jgi:RNA polymerase sigma-70 factor, ECF subfamily
LELFYCLAETLQTMFQSNASMPLSDVNHDLELLRRMRAGDSASMSLLYQRHQAPLYRFLLLRSGSSHVAADVVQDVFIALIEGRLNFDPARGALSSFLFGVARNFLLKRDEAAGRYSPMATTEEGEEVDIEDTAPLPLERILQSERAEAVRAQLMRLAPHYRDVLILYELHELSYVEIADVCRIDIGTVRSRLSRARSKLHALLTTVPCIADYTANAAATNLQHEARK